MLFVAEKKSEAVELNKSILEYENLEKQLEIVLLQRNQLKLQLSEIKNAEEELRHATGDVYHSIGSLMLKTTKDKAEKDLKDKKELVEVKLNALLKEEEKIRNALVDLQKRLQEKMKEYGTKKK